MAQRPNCLRQSELAILTELVHDMSAAVSRAHPLDGEFVNKKHREIVGRESRPAQRAFVFLNRFRMSDIDLYEDY